MGPSSGILLLSFVLSVYLMAVLNAEFAAAINPEGTKPFYWDVRLCDDSRGGDAKVEPNTETHLPCWNKSDPWPEVANSISTYNRHLMQMENNIIGMFIPGLTGVVHNVFKSVFGITFHEPTKKRSDRSFNVLLHAYIKEEASGPVEVAWLALNNQTSNLEPIELNTHNHHSSRDWFTYTKKKGLVVAGTEDSSWALGLVSPTVSDTTNHSIPQQWYLMWTYGMPSDVLDKYHFLVPIDVWLDFQD